MEKQSERDTGPRRRVSDKNAVTRAAVNPFAFAGLAFGMVTALIGVTVYLGSADAQNHEMASKNELRIDNLQRARAEDRGEITADFQEIKEELGSIEAKIDALLLRDSRPRGED